MTPYSFALTVFRLVAVGLLLHLLYAWVAYLLAPVPDFGAGANIPRIMEFQQQSIVRSSLFTLGSAAFIYFLAPVLARLVTIGRHD